MNASALRIQHREFTESIGDAVALEAARTPGGMKAIAYIANINERTVENIAQKRSAPNGFTLVKLMAALPQVQAEVRRLASMESDMDPELERDLTILLTRYTRMKGGE